MSSEQTTTPNELKLISEMSSNELDALIHNIREARAEPVRVWEAAQEAKKALKHEKDVEKLDKVLNMFEKAKVRSDKAIAEMEKRAFQIRATRLELRIFDG